MMAQWNQPHQAPRQDQYARPDLLPQPQPTEGVPFAIAAFVCGLASCLLCSPMSVLAIIFGGIGMSRSRPGQAGRGFAVAGFILGLIGFALGVLMGILLLMSMQAQHAQPSPPE
jgi:Domain of unknown function (DUF4190)